MSILKRINEVSVSYNGSAFVLSDSISLETGEKLYVLSVPSTVTSYPTEVTVLSVSENIVTLTSEAVFTGIAADDIVTFGKSFALKDPKSFQWDLADLESQSGRNQMGKSFKDRIDMKRSISCSWGALENEEISLLLNMINDIFFYLEYPDALSGERELRVFGVSNKTVPMLKQNNDGNILWTSLSATFTER